MLSTDTIAEFGIPNPQGIIKRIRGPSATYTNEKRLLIFSETMNTGNLWTCSRAELSLCGKNMKLGLFCNIVHYRILSILCMPLLMRR
jgi:hypothetical protein